MNIIKIPIIILTAIMVLGIYFIWHKNHKTPPLDISGNPDVVVSVSSEDVEMNGAIERAKREFNFFADNWKTTKNCRYSLKFELPNSVGGYEYIWFNPIEISGEIITAQCANAPDKVDGLKVGDVRQLNIKQLSDWMIVDGGKCYGGYTIRVLTKRRPNDKRPFEFVDIDK